MFVKLGTFFYFCDLKLHNSNNCYLKDKILIRQLI